MRCIATLNQIRYAWLAIKSLFRAFSYWWMIKMDTWAWPLVFLKYLSCASIGEREFPSSSSNGFTASGFTAHRNNEELNGWREKVKMRFSRPTHEWDDRSMPTHGGRVRPRWSYTTTQLRNKLRGYRRINGLLKFRWGTEVSAASVSRKLQWAGSLMVKEEASCRWRWRKPQ